MRIIYHIDVNSAFLSWQACHMLKTTPDSVDIRTIPSVIGGSEKLRHGIVLAKSSPAKKYNIQTAETLVSARKKCPGLVIIPPDYEIYVRYSSRFIDLLQQYAPVIEQYSIDEVFCDMTGTEKLYGNPVDFAHRLKNIIKKELGFTVNIGVSENKLLAKMASDFEKPDKVHTLFPSEIREKMWPLPVNELFFAGKSSVAKIHSLGIHTIGELASTYVSIHRSVLIYLGEVLWNYAYGHDLELVTDHKVPAKGFGNSVTTAFDVTDEYAAGNILLSLCETVGARIRAAKAYISVVTVTIVGNDFSRYSRQTSLPSTTDSTEMIYEISRKLFSEIWDGTPIRLLGVSTGKVQNESYEQLTLFDNTKNDRLKQLDSAIDRIRHQYGEDSLIRASFLETKNAPMTQGMNKAKRNLSNSP